MKPVKYVGDNPELKGATATQREDGKVQLNGPKGMFKNGGQAALENYPYSFGWHDLGDEWVEY